MQTSSETFANCVESRVAPSLRISAFIPSRHDTARRATHDNPPFEKTTRDVPLESHRRCIAIRVTRFESYTSRKARVLESWENTPPALAREQWVGIVISRKIGLITLDARAYIFLALLYTHSPSCNTIVCAQIIARFDITPTRVFVLQWNILHTKIQGDPKKSCTNNTSLRQSWSARIHGTVRPDEFNKTIHPNQRNLYKLPTFILSLYLQDGPEHNRPGKVTGHTARSARKTNCVAGHGSPGPCIVFASRHRRSILLREREREKKNGRKVKRVVPLCWRSVQGAKTIQARREAHVFRVNERARGREQFSLSGWVEPNDDLV